MGIVSPDGKASLSQADSKSNRRGQVQCVPGIEKDRAAILHEIAAGRVDDPGAVAGIARRAGDKHFERGAEVDRQFGERTAEIADVADAVVALEREGSVCGRADRLLDPFRRLEIIIEQVGADAGADRERAPTRSYRSESDWRENAFPTVNLPVSGDAGIRTICDSYLF